MHSAVECFQFSAEREVSDSTTRIFQVKARTTRGVHFPLEPLALSLFSGLSINFTACFLLERSLEAVGLSMIVGLL
jgi:hypothetical protein